MLQKFTILINITDLLVSVWVSLTLNIIIHQLDHTWVSSLMAEEPAVY